MPGIAIVGKSGTGKSTSYGQIPEIGIKGLDPKETVVVNVANKDLPFRGWKKKYSGKINEKGNLLVSSDADTITKAVQYINNERPDIKNIVIDDAQYEMSFNFMSKANETGYKKFAVIGTSTSKLVTAAKNTRQDLKVYFLWHPETDESGEFKMKTIGKMLDSYITLEGLFSVVLYSRVTKDNSGKPLYQFVTNHDGTYPSKSPVGMFPELHIPNDLGVVSETIDKYNEGE